MPNYKYNEDSLIQEVREYIDSTYGQHYVADKEVQVVDLWKALGTLETTARDTAVKYLCRYGKKDGKNKKDLLKAIHYIILMMHAAEDDKDNDIVINLDDLQLDPSMFNDSEFELNIDINDSYDKVSNYDTHSWNKQ